MITFLDLLIIVSMVLIAASLLSVVLMFLVKNRKIRLVCLGLVSALGLYVGYKGGLMDNLLIKISDIFQSIPQMVLIIIIVAAVLVVAGGACASTEQARDAQDAVSSMPCPRCGAVGDWAVLHKLKDCTDFYCANCKVIVWTKAEENNSILHTNNNSYYPMTP